MEILITGGAGFIGSHTAEHLTAAGHRVRIVDNLSTGSRDNLEAVRDSVDIQEFDILDLRRLTEACEGIDGILHLAAIASVAESIDNPVRTHEVNAAGSLNVLEAARRRNVRRVILASSASVYGDGQDLPKTEDSPTRPLSPYAWHKLSGEFYGGFFRDVHGLEFTALRYFNVYGPRQDPESPYSGVLSIFARNAKQGEQLVIYGDGGQTRDFIHVSDVAAINRLALETGWPLPGIINVATGIETPIIAAARIASAAAPGGDGGIVFKEPRQGDIRRSFADNSLMVSTFGLEPQVSFETGFRDLLDSGIRS